MRNRGNLLILALLGAGYEGGGGNVSLLPNMLVIPSDRAFREKLATVCDSCFISICALGYSLGVHVVANDDVFQNSFVFSAKTLRPFAMFALLDFTHAFTHAGFEWVAVALIFFRRAFLCSWQPDCLPGGVSLCIVPTCKVVICATQN